jgi:hypothetical protein
MVPGAAILPGTGEERQTMANGCAAFSPTLNAAHPGEALLNDLILDDRQPQLGGGAQQADVMRRILTAA